MDKTRDRNTLKAAMAASRGAFAAAGLFSFFINALMLTVPLFMLQVYDRVLSSGSEETLVMLAILAVGLLTTAGVLEFLRSRVLVRIGTGLEARLQSDVFRAVHRLRLQGVRGLDEQPILDLETLRTFFAGGGLVALFDAPWTPMFLFVIFLLHPLLGLIALCGALLLLLTAVAGELLTKAPHAAARRERGEAFAFAQRILRNTEVIEAMGVLPAAHRRWRQRHDNAVARYAHTSDIAGTTSAIAKTLRSGLQIAILGVGAHLAIDGAITAGVMVVASIIMGRALAPLEASIRSWRSVTNAKVSYRRLNLVLAQGDARGGVALATEPAGRISVENVCAAPPRSDAAVLNNLRFDIAPGEVVAIVGDSAAGKSTLARHMVGIWRPLSGQIRFDGIDMAQLDPVELGPHIGYLPQDVALFDGTVADNIARLETPEPAAVVAAAKRAGVHEMILRMPNGYSTAVGDAGGALSGGQRQRIGLARALFGDPALVVLDEPNANLDADGDTALRRTVRDLKSAGKTVVIVTHRRDILPVADRILVISDGTMAEERQVSAGGIATPIAVAAS